MRSATDRMLLLFSCSRILGPTPFTDATDSSLSGLGELLAARELCGPLPLRPLPGGVLALQTVRTCSRRPGVRRGTCCKAGWTAGRLPGGTRSVQARLVRPRDAAAAGCAMQVCGCGAAAAPLEDVKTSCSTRKTVTAP